MIGYPKLEHFRFKLLYLYLFLMHALIPKPVPAFGDMLQLFQTLPETGFPAGLIQTAKQKGRPDNPSGLFLNANAQTPAWPLLAGPPPTVDDDIARNVHGRTVSVQCVSLQPEN